MDWNSCRLQSSTSRSCFTRGPEQVSAPASLNGDADWRQNDLLMRHRARYYMGRKHFAQGAGGTLCVAAPDTRLAYIWNQWLNTSSISSARKQKCQRGCSTPSVASRPAVASLRRSSVV